MSQAGRQAQPPKDRSLVLSLMSGPIIWSVYFLIGYILVEAACKAGFWSNQAPGGITLLGLVIVALTLVALAASLYGTYLAYRSLKLLRGENEFAWEAEGRSQFMALSGIILGLLFSGVILFTGIPVFLLSPCVWGG